jgi:GT2 family glycosyltransferase
VTRLAEAVAAPMGDPRVQVGRHWSHGCDHGSAGPEPEPLSLSRGVTAVLCTHARPESLERCLASLLAQETPADQIVVVDSSDGRETQDRVEAWFRENAAARCCRYFRVGGSLRGLTRQRNFGLRWAAHDLVVFFDDDVVARPACLAQMQRPLREPDDRTVGAGAVVENEPADHTWLWRLRRLIGIVPSLRPGRYFGSGMSTPWGHGDGESAWIDGDWLPGCAMMWRTAAARELGFHEDFGGYAQGEDLDFSLRARSRGRLVLARDARVLHLHEAAGRPDHFKMGYMTILNRFRIHQRALPERRWTDVAWFVYAWGTDTVLLARHFVFPSRWRTTLAHVAGRLRAARELLSGR